MKLSEELIYRGFTAETTIKNPEDFSDNAGGTKIGTWPSSYGYISSWSITSTAGFEYALFPSGTSGSSRTYVTDFCSIYTSEAVLAIGGMDVKDSMYGLFFVISADSSEKRGYYGSRLQKLP